MSNTAKPEINTEEYYMEGADYIFEMFHLIWPTFKCAFKSGEHEYEVKKLWAEELQERGIRPQDVKRGIRQCKRTTRQFTPGLGLFIHWCIEDPDNYEEE